MIIFLGRPMQSEKTLWQPDSWVCLSACLSSVWRQTFSIHLLVDTVLFGAHALTYMYKSETWHCGRVLQAGGTVNFLE